MHSEDGLTTPTIEKAIFGRNFTSPAIEPPAECIVFGQLLDAEGLPRVGVVIIISHSGFVHGDTLLEADIEDRTVFVTDAAGEFQFQIIETESISLSPYSIRIDDMIFRGVQIPNQATADFSDLALPQPVPA